MPTAPSQVQQPSYDDASSVSTASAATRRTDVKDWPSRRRSFDSLVRRSRLLRHRPVVANCGLAEVRPEMDGWYADLAIGADVKDTLELYVDAVKTHFAEIRPDASFVSPFSSALPEEREAGAEARLRVKVST